MALRNARPVSFVPKGLTDAYDSTQAFSGSCRLLQNLVFDQGNPELLQARPGVVSLTTFPGFTTPTFVTVFIVINGVVYGMVSTARTAGFDEPFAYNVAANTFTTITGVTAGNVPSSPSTSGAWTPPTMAVIGTKIIVTHPGFSGSGSNFFGIIDISTPSAPTWTASNLATNALPSVPTAVANFNNRAWYVCNNVVYYSDVLVPATRTNASQSVTVGDPSSVIAMSGLPVQTTSAGVVQALIVFKSFSVWQITGDTATSNLALNFLSLNIGTTAARSVVQTPFGTNFMAADGPYIVDALGTVKPLTKTPQELTQDIQLPFINSQQPTRTSAAYFGGIYRICVDTYLNSSASTNDYWFDIERRRWNGPHTWPHDCCGAVNNYFVISHRTKGAVLYQSQFTSSLSAVYTDAGTAITCIMQSSSLPKDANMNEKYVLESTIELSTAGASASYQIQALDDQLNVLNNTLIMTTGAGYTWGGHLWGSGKWSSSINIPHVYTIAWSSPLVFQKMSIQVNVTSSINISIGEFRARYQDLGYVNQ